MRNYLLNPIAFFCCLVLQVPASVGQGTDRPAPGIFEMLSRNEIVEIHLETNMDTLMDRKKKDIYTEGRFSFERGKDETLTLPVNIRCRGKFRRMKCSFPPLKLKFKKSDLAAHGLNEFNELKLVTHCLDEKETSKELILREYLVYKLFNELTPHSFRVQLVKVTYLNTGKKMKKIKGWGILIEDEDNLAYRMGGEISSRMGVPGDSLETNQEALVSLFQYMVGNTDWSTLLNRNVQLVLMPQGNYLVAPYDFDYSGIVSAPYARPSAELGQKSITDRVFLGHADTLDELKPTLQLFLSRQESLQRIILDCPQLKMESKSRILAYLHEFFELIRDDARIAAALLSVKSE